MSQEHAELLHRAIDAFNRRDLDAYLELMDPDVEFTPYEVGVQGGQPYRGHVGVRSWWSESFEVLPDFKADIYETQDFGDKTFVHGCIRAHGAGSGAPITQMAWLAIEWRDKKAVWWYSYATREEALKAVGLEE